MIALLLLLIFDFIEFHSICSPLLTVICLYDFVQIVPTREIILLSHVRFLCLLPRVVAGLLMLCDQWHQVLDIVSVYSISYAVLLLCQQILKQFFLG
jgi:hypothetical protein